MKKQENLTNAGKFSAWLEMTKGTIQNRGDVKVPCGNCTACCTSGFYIAVGKHELGALKRIPEDLLNKIPGMPDLYYIGFNKKGHCHLLKDGLCSIYEDRPYSCRTFDCRVFTATGIDLDKDPSSPVNKKIREWRFNYPTRKDREQQDALKMAAAILKETKDPGLMDQTSENRRILALNAVLHMEKILSTINEIMKS